MTVAPGRWSMPSRTATTRPMLKPCSPPGRPQPSIGRRCRRVELGDLVQRGLDDRGGQVVGAQVLQRALEGAADGGAGGGDDDGFGHAGDSVRRGGPRARGRHRMRGLDRCHPRPAAAARDVAFVMRRSTLRAQERRRPRAAADARLDVPASYAVGLQQRAPCRTPSSGGHQGLGPGARRLCGCRRRRGSRRRRSTSSSAPGRRAASASSGSRVAAMVSSSWATSSSRASSQRRNSAEVRATAPSWSPGHRASSLA